MDTLVVIATLLTRQGNIIQVPAPAPIIIIRKEEEEPELVTTCYLARQDSCWSE
jgi:hypothetical protein